MAGKDLYNPKGQIENLIWSLYKCKHFFPWRFWF